MPEDERRKLRNCDSTTNRNLVIPWAGGRVPRCPWAIQDEAWIAVKWWRDWKDFSSLPDPGLSLKEHPAYVEEAIRLCEYTYQEEADKRQDEDRTTKGSKRG